MTQVFNTIKQFKDFRSKFDSSSIIGFVPTMGALHDGHVSLIERAKKECDFVVCSVFVNPTQFDKKEDLDRYPRTLDKDVLLLSKAGVDAVFAPHKEEVYLEKYFLSFNFGALEKVMEGKCRDGHFNGVATVVSKLFNIVKPHKAFFGQKDLQQVAIVKDLVKALSFDIQVVTCPIVRNENGLALSSRNERLSDQEKNKALVFNHSLRKAISVFKETKNVVEAKKIASDFFFETMGYAPEYLEIVDSETLQSPENTGLHEYAVCIAGEMGSVRLIDNELFSL